MKEKKGCDVLILDAYMLIHRARSGFTKGKNPVIYNFFRGLRPLIEKFEPSEVIFALEGIPKARLELDANYKGNRVRNPEDPKWKEFIRQRDMIIEMVKIYFPFRVARAPDHEADDLVAHFARDRADAGLDVVVISADTDFIQLLQEGRDVRLWNPISKSFRQAPDYDYVKWKALRGDSSDNIAGVPGVGDKTAERLCKDANLFEEKMKQEGARALVKRNIEMIKMPEIESEIIEFAPSNHDWEGLKETFGALGFRSMLKENSWRKYEKTFEGL